MVLIIGNSTAQFLTGTSLADTISGAGADDILFGGDGIDVLYGDDDPINGGGGGGSSGIFEFLVNTTTASDQSASSVIRLSGGRFVATWQSLDQDGSFSGIYAQIFDADGLKIGNEVLVNTTTIGHQVTPDVAALNDGSYVIVWRSYTSNTVSTIFTQAYTSLGVAVGGETAIGTVPGSTSGASEPVITKLSDGGYAVTWASGGNIGVSDIYVETFNAAGGVVTGPTIIASDDGQGDVGVPNITALTGGGYVVTWMRGIIAASGQSFARQFDASGVALGPMFAVSTSQLDVGQHEPVVSGLLDGSYVVAWGTEDGASVFMRHFSATGVALTPTEVVVNAPYFDAGGNMSFTGVPAIAALAGGGYVIVWQSNAQDAANSWGIYAQRFSATDQALGGPFLVNIALAPSQVDATITATDSGGFVVAWTSAPQDGSGAGVYSIRYDADGTPTAVGDVTNSRNDELNGGLGNDQLYGGAGNDALFGDGDNDALFGGTDNDELYGGIGNDALTGGLGDDRIDGGSGIDRASLDGTANAVVSLALTGAQATGYGTDTILGVENITSGTGNDQLTGNTLANSLLAGDGNDTLIGGFGNDSLIGGNGNDFLTGGAGNDVMNGGVGSDRAFYSSASGVTVSLAIVVAQATGEGTDTLVNIEHLSSGSGNDTLTGSALANSLNASSGNDVLSGGNGNDTLAGGIGIDTLTGGLGNDAFVFNTALGAANVDVIADFNVISDTMRIENAIFTGLAAGVLGVTAFAANATGVAADASDRIIYNTVTGQVYFDADGNLGGARSQFATLSAIPVVTQADFLII